MHLFSIPRRHSFLEMVKFGVHGFDMSNMMHFDLVFRSTGNTWLAKRVHGANRSVGDLAGIDVNLFEVFC